MFRTAELGQKLSKKDYKKIEPVLRQELLEAQRQLGSLAQTPVIIIFAGVDGAGKGSTVNLLNEWMDTRWLINRAYRNATDEESERPEFWRYWRDLPPKGRINLFLNSWYSKPLLDRAYGNISMTVLDEHLDQILAFENTLANDGALILKFWMHLSRRAQKTRYKALEKDPLLRWKVTETDWEHWHHYDAFIGAAERIIMRTNTEKARWNIIEGVDNKFSSVHIATIIRDALRRQINGVLESRALENNVFESNVIENTVIENTALENNKTTPPPPSIVATDINSYADADQQAIQKTTPQTIDTNANTEKVDKTSHPLIHVSPQKTVLSQLDMSATLNKSSYKSQLKAYQARLNLLHREAMQAGLPTIVVFEGPDAAGKGGAIRRVIPALDPHRYQVLPFAAPTDEERAQHYLWRFWRRLPRAGHLNVFDRSWYGRVLVERVEGFATEQQWNRAYSEINAFEEQLIAHGSVLIKYWIHITQEEQLVRFNARQNTPYKNWKLTDEDWRNREKWSEYEAAAHDMVQYTSTHPAPWVLVAGNNKYHARITVLKTLVSYLETALHKPSNKNLK